MKLLIVLFIASWVFPNNKEIELEKLFIECKNNVESVEKLDPEVAQKCFREFGIDENLNHVRAKFGDEVNIILNIF